MFLIYFSEFLVQKYTFFLKSERFNTKKGKKFFYLLKNVYICTR